MLEALLGNHEVRKAKHEIKRRTKKPIEKVSRENTQRKVIDRWLGNEKLVTREREKGNFGENNDQDREKVSEKLGFGKGGPKSVTLTDPRHISKQNLEKLKQRKVTENSESERHDREKKKEKSNVEGKNMPEKGEQLVQKEKELKMKIQIWDQHFTEKQAVMKNMGRNENEKGWVEHRTEITNQTRLEKNKAIF